MSLVDEVNDRIGQSVWGQWFEKADNEAVALAQGRPRSRGRNKSDPPEVVVALLAIADLREVVLQLAKEVDRLIEQRTYEQ